MRTLIHKFQSLVKLGVSGRVWGRWSDSMVGEKINSQILKLGETGGGWVSPQPIQKKVCVVKCRVGGSV